MTIQLTIPDDLKDRLAALATEHGYATLEQYAEALLCSGLEEVTLSRDDEREVLRRLADPTPPVDYNDQFRTDFLRQLAERDPAR
jgi:hypothetical protein